MLAALLLAASVAGANPAPAGPASSLEARLAGEWSVCLFWSETAAPSRTQLILDTVEPAEGGGGGALTGSFYGSALENGRVVERGGRIVLAAMSSDASARYFHSAALEGERLAGQTLSPERGFLIIWSAVRGEDCLPAGGGATH